MSEEKKKVSPEGNFKPVLEIGGVECTLTRVYTEGENLKPREIKMTEPQTGAKAVYTMKSYT